MDYYLGAADIVASARKHGVADEDIRHALKHHWAAYSTDDTAVTTYIGPSMSAQPLEIVVVRSAADAIIIHAMPARRRFLP